MSLIESTYKSLETEEWLDIKFYRPLGYYIAGLSKTLRITPNAISVTGMLIGILAGHLFYYQNLTAIIPGILLLIFSEILDSADGQLARMTNKKSKFGRILDGFASNLIFISIYFHISLRLASEGYEAIWLAALLSAVSHSIQSAAADRYRNAYVNYTISPDKSELESSEKLNRENENITWSKNPLQKFWTIIYRNYTLEQEMISPNFTRLWNYTRKVFQKNLPDDLVEQYKASIAPHIKYYNILTSNTRMICLFITLLLNITWLYFFFEIVVLNILLIPIVIRQEFVSRNILDRISIYQEEVR